MIKYYYKLFICSALIVCFLPVVSSQAKTKASKEASSQELRLLKIQISTLMLEKNQLEEQQNALQAEYTQIKNEFAESMREIIAVDSSFLKNRNVMKRHERIVEDLGRDLEGLEDQYLIEKFKNAYLSRELIDEKELQSLRRLQLSDLYLQKRNLELDLKWREFERDEALLKHKDQMAMMQKDLQDKIAKARDLALFVSQVESGESLSPQKKALENRRKQLKDKVQQLKDRLEQFETSKAHFEEKAKTAQQALSKPVKQHLKKKQEMQVLVDDLEAQYESLSSVVSESFSREKRFQSLMEEMVFLDRQNQILRRKISALESQMSSIK